MSPPSFISRLKADATTRMKAAGVPDAERSALILLQHVTGATAAQVFAGDVPVSTEQRAEFGKLVDRRARREPLQYILGNWPFWKHEFSVSPEVLIPRPESEHILEVLLEKTSSETGGMLVDCCTGSGCLAISAAFERPQLSIVGTDISAAALKVAETNRRNLNCRPVHWMCTDMLSAFRPDSVDMIIANPPYVAETDAATLEPELAHEPSVALFSGTTGMDHIDRLVNHSTRILKKDGLLIFEFGYNQGNAVRRTVQGIENRSVGLETRTDLRGVERVAIVEFI